MLRLTNLLHSQGEDAITCCATDKLLPHLQLGLSVEQAEGIPTNWRRSILLVPTITLHNIHEGFAVGAAFGAVAAGLPSASLGAVLLLQWHPSSQHLEPLYPSPGHGERNRGAGATGRGVRHRKQTICHTEGAWSVAAGIFNQLIA